MGQHKPSQTSLSIPDEDDIEQTHRWLADKKKSIEASLSIHAAEIGEYLIQTFFQGDVEQACSHNPRKQNSLRKLSDRMDAPFSLAALRTFIQVAQNFRLLPPEQAALLPPSHHALLYRVANPDERIELARCCAENQTSAGRLRELVKGRGRRRPGAGRKPDPPRVRDLRMVRHEVERVRDKLTRTGTDQTEVDELIAEARGLRDQLVDLLDLLEDQRADPSRER